MNEWWKTVRNKTTHNHFLKIKHHLRDAFQGQIRINAYVEERQIRTDSLTQILIQRHQSLSKNPTARQNSV